MLTQKQLVQILGNPESYNIEITTSTTNMDKFCQAICAFSNDLPGILKNVDGTVDMKDVFQAIVNILGE